MPTDLEDPKLIELLATTDSLRASMLRHRAVPARFYAEYLRSLDRRQQQPLSRSPTHACAPPSTVHVPPARTRSSARRTRTRTICN